MEEFSQLQLTTPPRHTWDDFYVTPLLQPRLELNFAESEGKYFNAALENNVDQRSGLARNNIEKSDMINSHEQEQLFASDP